MEEFLWYQKYRPQKIEDCILPDSIKDTFKAFVEAGDIPDLLLVGPSGTGKTTVAIAMLEELGLDYILLNGSMSGNIDTLRNEIMGFASSVSFTGKRKFVILDEADGLNRLSFQPALRNFMETYSKNCGFILTANFRNKVIDAIHSRCSVIDFGIRKTEINSISKLFFARVKYILQSEGAKFDTKAVAEVIVKYFPDFRRIINELQKYAANGTIDSGILGTFKDENIKDLVNLLKEKKYTEVRNWIKTSDIDTNDVYVQFYEHAKQYFKPEVIPQLVLILAKYQFQAASVSNQDINLCACLTEILIECGEGFHE